jgi:hypothetical protein
MVETRNHSNEKKEEDVANAGDKHKTEHDSPEPKRAKTGKQTTIEESMGNSTDDDKKSDPSNAAPVKDEAAKDHKKGGKKEADQSVSNGSAEQPSKEHDVPSNILEKGIIYFFMRGRVDIDSPSSVDEIQRTYIILRPIHTDAKLGEGPIGDVGNSRLLVLPKKVFPQSGKDRFMMFVEKSGASFGELKKEFLEGKDYETKTVGHRHTPAATPVGEGVYAMTSTGRESHLAYMLTLPEKLDQVQKELGLKDKGSFILSTKNPEYKGPANAQLPEGPDFPKK